MIALLIACLCAQLPAAREEDHYAVDFLTPPAGAVLEVGGMDFLPDGRLALSTRRGQVWLVENPLARNPADARFHLFAEGLHEGLGLKVVNGEILVVQRTELSRLRDTDQDGEADRIDLISNDWGASGNYHEFAYGLAQDREGDLYVSLNVGFWDPQWWHGHSRAPYRGWVMRIAPDGTTTPFAMGFRSPNGMGTNAQGDLFVTDNQGDWMPACPMFHVREGRFYGHPASLAWTPEYRSEQRTPSDTEPPARARTPPAIWFPYGLSRSTGALTWDSTSGKFGPFAGQLFVAELTNGLVMRVQLEQVQGEYQGAVLAHRHGVGSANRVVFAPDGTLLVGLTNRGWGGEAPADGIARVRYTGVLPMEIETVHLLDDGFELRFTKPLARDLALAADRITLTQYDYSWWWEYGSPETSSRRVPVGSVAIAADRRSLVLRAPLVAGMMARVQLSAVRADDGTPLLHDQFDYTINQLPHGHTDKQIANLVPPPPTREERNRGWLSLFDGRSLDSWNGSGWRTAEYTLAMGDRSKLPVIEGEGELVNDQGPEGRASDLVSRYEFGDVEAKLAFALPRGGNSGIYLMGRYEVQLLDSYGKEQVGPGDCGGIYEGFGEGNRWPGRAPDVNACLPPCDMQKLELKFLAPRFDATGKKIANARFVSVKLNDRLIHENVEVPNPTRGGLEGEVPLGPLRLQGDHGPVVFDQVDVRPLESGPAEAEGWRPLFDGRGLSGWHASGKAEWRVANGVLTGSGGRGTLWSERTDYRSFEWRARVRINHLGAAGMWFRAAPGEPIADGYDAPINSSATDPVRTGSLAGLCLIKNRLVRPDVWFTEQVSCEDTAEGVHVVIRVNGIVVTDVVDKKRQHAQGALALDLAAPGTVVEWQSLEVREHLEMR